MHKFSITIGEIVAPVVFMVFIGYHAGKYWDQMVVFLTSSLIIGFIVALFNIWKLMKKLGRKDE
jgi:predicted membrane protein